MRSSRGHRVPNSRSSLGRTYAGVRGALALGAIVVSLAAPQARAGDTTEELWPELNLYVKTSDTTRLYFAAAYAEERDYPSGTLDLAGHLDITLKPILRHSLRQQDWRARRYFWVRLGYDHVFITEDRVAQETSEQRGIVAVHGRTWLPGRVLVEGRLRADLRWIGDDYSTRYRTRLEINRDFLVAGRMVTPYLQIEAFYDTRYDGWARSLYQIGAEFEVSQYLHLDGWNASDFRIEAEKRVHFRLEPYIARQVDRLPEDSAVLAFGIVARWYY